MSTVAAVKEGREAFIKMVAEFVDPIFDFVKETVPVIYDGKVLFKNISDKTKQLLKKIQS